MIYREIFYVRNHLPVPLVEIEDYKLEITGLGVNETKLSLDDLKTKFPKVSVIATIQCAGNRRSEMSEVVFQLLKINYYTNISLNISKKSR